MDTYIINGVEVEYDTFDAVNLDLVFSEGDILTQAENKFTDGLASGRPNFTEYAESLRDFFDVLIGEGTSEKCFGPSRNVKLLSKAATAFIQDLGEKMKGMEPEEIGLPPSNRDQRRAQERADRRKAAVERVKARA